MTGANTITINVGARDQSAAAFNQADVQARAFAARTTRMLDQLSARRATIQLNTTRTEQQLATLREQLEDATGDRRVEIEARIAVAEARLRALGSQADELTEREREIRVRAETRQAELDLRRAQRASDDLGESSPTVRPDVDRQGVLGKFKGLAGGLAGLALTAGVAAGAALTAGIGQALERGQVEAKLAASLGASGARAQDLGATAGKIWASGFGESMADVGVAVKRVVQDIGDLGEGAQGGLQGLAQKAMTVSQVFDQDLGGVTRAVGQMLRTGLARDADEAFDIITAGMQQGADKAEDLLETYNEYATQFRSIGLSGKTAMGLLSQGLQAGARDADVVADAIKEFTLEAVKGGKSVMGGFRSLGMDAAATSAALAKGGDGAAKAFDTVLDRLRAIEDPVRRNQVAFELFGTKSEDLQKALYALDPSTAVDALGQVEGAAQRAGDTMADTTASKIERFKRRVTSAFGEAAGAAIGWGESLEEQAGPKAEAFWQKVEPGLSRLADKVIPAVQTAIQSLVGYAEGWISTAKRIGEEVMPLVEMAMDNVRSAVDDLQASGIPWTEVFRTAGTVMGVLAGVVAGVVVAALTALSFQLKIAAKLVVPLYEAFKLAARIIIENLGHILHTAAIAFGWIPGIGPKLKAADKEFRDFSTRVLASLNRIPNNKVTTLTFRQVIQDPQVQPGPWKSGYTFARGTGGITSHAAEGGARGGQVLVGEYGPELVELPGGSMVRSNPDTQRILTAGGGGPGGAGPVATVQFAADGEIGRLFIEVLRRAVRTSGTRDVQLLFGGALS